METLTILCVTTGDAAVLPMLLEQSVLAGAIGATYVVAADGPDALERLIDVPFLIDVVLKVQSRGFIESVLDECVEQCRTDYVFRLDDDETASPALRDWLAAGAYRQRDHWKFARVHLWGDRAHAVVTPHLWPDHQTRLSTKAKSFGRSHIHCGSPFGGGDLAPAAIEHHKFLLRSVEQRDAIVARYDQVLYGAGSGFAPFQVPERFYPELPVVAYADGQVEGWPT